MMAGRFDHRFCEPMSFGESIALLGLIGTVAAIVMTAAYFLCRWLA